MKDLRDMLIKKIELYARELRLLKAKNEMNPKIEHRDQYHNLSGRIQSLQFILGQLDDTRSSHMERRREERRRV